MTDLFVAIASGTLQQWVPLLIGGCCLALGGLCFLLFRKIRRLDREMNARQVTINKLEKELTVKDAVQEKAFRIMSEVENAAGLMGDMFTFYAKLFNFKYAVLAFHEPFSNNILQFTHPKNGLKPDQFLNWLQSITPSGQMDVCTPIPVKFAKGEVPFLEAGTAAGVSDGMVFLFKPGSSVGGVFLALDEAEWKKIEKDVCRMLQVFNALTAYRLMQGEITYRNEEANLLSVFLTEITVFIELEKLLDAIYEFFRDSYQKCHVSLILEGGGGVCVVKRGKLIEEEIVLHALPKVRLEVQRGRQMVYAPDPASLVKKFEIQQRPVELKALLIVPLSAFNEVFGYVVFEALDPNPFRSNMLSTLIHVVEVASFVLRKSLYFQRETEKKNMNIQELEKQLVQLRSDLQARDLAIRELSNFNAVFSLVQSVKKDLASLRGFMKLLEDTWKSAAANVYDPLLFRNCLVEMDKIQKNMQKFELTRVITDRDFMFKRDHIKIPDFISKVFTPIRSKALLKKVELETKIDEGLDAIVVDAELTGLAMQQFLEKLLDYLADGQMVALCLRKERQLELLVRFMENETAIRSGNSLLSKDLTQDFNFVLLSRLMARQGGKMNFEVSGDRSFILRLLLPVES